MAGFEIDSYLDEVVEPTPGEVVSAELGDAMRSMVTSAAPARPKRKKKGKPNAEAPDDAPSSSSSSIDASLTSLTASGVTSTLAIDVAFRPSDEDPVNSDNSASFSDASLLSPASEERFDQKREEIGEEGREVFGKEEEAGEACDDFAFSTSGTKWSAIEITRERVDALVDAAVAKEISSAASHSPAKTGNTTSTFTGAFALDDDDAAAFVDGGRESSASSSPHNDVVMEEVKESDSSSFEYIMASSPSKDEEGSPTSEFSSVDFGEGAREVPEEREKENMDGDRREMRATGDDISVNSNEMTEGVASVGEVGASFVEVEDSSDEPCAAAAVGLRGLIGRVRPSELRDDDDDDDDGEIASLEEELIRGQPIETRFDDAFQVADTLAMKDSNDESSLILNVPPMLDDVVSQEFSFSAMDFDSSQSDYFDGAYASSERDKPVVHPFIFAATDCPPLAPDDDERLSPHAPPPPPPPPSLSVEQFEDLGENDGSGGVGGVESFHGDISFPVDPSFGDSFSRPSSLSASFRGSLPRQPSSSALASLLYARSREGSFGEGDSSASIDKGMAAEEMDALVKDLREEKKALEDQVEDLKEELAQYRSRTDALKSENHSLTSRLFEMEDQIRIVEMEAKTREMNDDKTLQETVSKLEKQNLEMMNQFTETNVDLMAENEELKADFHRTRKELDAAKLELLRTEEKYLESQTTAEERKKSLESTEAEAESQRRTYEEERKTTAEIMEEMTREIDDFKRFYSDAQPLVKMRTTSYADLPNKVADLEAELKATRMENAELMESKDELEMQLMNVEMNAGGGSGGGGGGALSPSDNLEAEMDRASKEELVKLVQVEKDVNKQLKEYVDKIILVILENRPELLEIMASMEVKTRG